MATIDSLDIQISGSVQKANQAIDSLITNLDKLANSLKIDTSGLEKIGKFLNFSGVDKAAKNIQSQTQKISKSLSQITEQYKDLGKSFEIKGSTQQIQKQIDNLTNQLAKAKLAKEDFEASGKTDLGGYETAVKNVIKYTNQIESLKNQLEEMQTTNLVVDFKITGIENAEGQISDITEKLRTVSLPQSVFSYNVDAMKAVFGEMASGIENWSQATQKFGANAGAVLNQTTSKTDELKSKTEQFEQSLKNLQIPSINTDNINVLQRELTKSEANFEKLRVKLVNGITMGRISANVDDKGFRTLKEQMVIAEKTAEALREKIKQVNKVSSQTSNGAKNLGSSVKSASKSFSDLANSSTKAIKPLNSLKNSFKSLMRTILPILGIRQLFNWGKQSIEIASDLTEVQNVVDTTFGDMAYKVEDFAQNSIKQFGLSELSLKQFSSRFQAMGTAMGFPISRMSDISIELTKLTADMSSFYNVAQEDVAKNLQSIFTGETEPLRKYGLDLTQATLQEWAHKQGIEAKMSAMSQAEKTMLRYQYVMANTTAAQGDFARTADTWANQLRILKQNFEQLAAVIGRTFINALKPLVKALNAAMSYIIAFAKTISNALGKIFGWTFEEGGGVADDFGDAAGSAEDIADSTGTAANNIKKMQAGLRAFDELKVINMPDNNDGDGGTGGAGGLGGAGGALGGNWIQGDSLLKQYESEIDTLYKLGEYIGKILTEAMNSIDWDSVYEKARNFGKGLADFLNGLISPDLFGALGRTIAGALNTAVYAAISFGETFDWKDFGLSIATGINNFFAKFDFAALAQTINVWANGILDSIITFIDNTEWYLIGEKIGTFLESLDFAETAGKVAEAIWKAIFAALEAWTGSFREAPLETVLITAFAVLKWTKLGSFVSSKIAQAIASKLGIEIAANAGIGTALITALKTGFATALAGAGGLSGLLTLDVTALVAEGGLATAGLTIGTAIIGGVAAAIGGWNFGQFLYEKFTGEEIDMSWAEQFDEIKNSFSDGSWKEALDLWKEDIYNGLVQLGNDEEEWAKEFGNNLKSLWNEDISPWFTKERWSDLGDNIKTGLKSKWEEFSKWWKNTGIYNWWNNDVKPQFEENKWNFSGIKEGLSNAWNGAIESVKKIWNSFAGWLNEKLTWTIDPITIFGKTIFDGMTINLGKIPMLANGAVFKGGNPFLAVVNDQKRGQTNIETPLKVIQDALREELTKFSVNFKATVPNTTAMNYNYTPVPVPSYAEAYGNYQYDTSAYTTSRNNSNSDMSNAIENAVYRATYNAVSSAIGNSKMLVDIKSEIQKGHVIEMDGRTFAENARKYANEYFKRTGKAWIDF